MSHAWAINSFVYSIPVLTVYTSLLHYPLRCEVRLLFNGFAWMSFLFIYAFAMLICQVKQFPVLCINLQIAFILVLVFAFREVEII